MESRDYSLVAVRGLLSVVASLVTEHGLEGSWAPGFRAQAQQL